MRTKNLKRQESKAHPESGLLPIKFVGKGEVVGFLFERMHVDESWYIYRVTEYGCEWYEVFMRRRIFSTGKEMYPKAKVFGIAAWNARSLEKAFAIIVENSKSNAGSKRMKKPTYKRRSRVNSRKRAVKTAIN